MPHSGGGLTKVSPLKGKTGPRQDDFWKEFEGKEKRDKTPPGKVMKSQKQKDPP